MQKIGALRLGLLLGGALVVAAVAVVFATRSSGAGTRPASAARPLVGSAANRTLHRTVLVDRRGMTLYSLSAETHGRFICTTRFCLSLWTPLDVAHGTKPTGAVRLTTVRRPGGATQVAYRGRPLYTFAEDRKPGDAKGNGFKDVGVWLAATPKAAPAPAPAPTVTAGGGGYGY